MRTLFSGLMFLAVLIVTIVLLPSRVAHACLPCNCPTNRSVNCVGDYALYTQVAKNGDCSIEVLGVDRRGKPRSAIYVSARDLAKLPEFPEENTLIEEYYEFALYKLTSGEYQLNVGPDFEGKVFVINFTGCPASGVYESTFTVEPAG